MNDDEIAAAFRELEELERQLCFVPYWEWFYKKVGVWSRRYKYLHPIVHSWVYRTWGTKWGYLDVSRGIARDMAMEIRDEIDRQIIEELTALAHEQNSTDGRTPSQSDGGFDDSDWEAY